jgi:hypothetical protein
VEQYFSTHAREREAVNVLRSIIRDTDSIVKSAVINVKEETCTKINYIMLQAYTYFWFSVLGNLMYPTSKLLKLNTFTA